ncbi:MAG: aminoacyl-tRNA hydrolase [Hyphomicrobiales bacterium]|nr:aminoacyl-tRNA hydrolase [Hyphomicrobiales bacterium]
MIQVTRDIALADSELEFSFIHAAGPGGQNVNKVATAVQLRFDAAACPALDDALRARLRRLAGRRMTAAGELIIEARRFRSQERNRADAVARLVALVQKAAEPPRPRKATRPTAASKRRRVEAKKRRGALKRTRTERPGAED